MQIDISKRMKICNLKWWDSTGAFGNKKSTENLIHFVYYTSEIVAQIIVHIDYWWFKCKFITIKVWKEATIHCRNTELNDGTQDEHYSRPWFIDVQNYATQRFLLKASMCVRLFWGKSFFLFRNIDSLTIYTVCKLYTQYHLLLSKLCLSACCKSFYLLPANTHAHRGYILTHKFTWRQRHLPICHGVNYLIRQP